MTDTPRPAAAGAIVLDAAAPMMEPRWLAKRLPDVVAGGVDALLATVGSIEDFRTTMEVVGAWLEIDRSRKQPIRIARSGFCKANLISI